MQVFYAIGNAMNLGCVVYKKSFDSGNLFANWCFSFDDELLSGTGTATGQPGEDYVGEYVITYYDASGAQRGTYNLLIEKNDSFYELKWFQNKILKHQGVGMLQDNDLVASWKKV